MQPILYLLHNLLSDPTISALKATIIAYIVDMISRVRQ